MAKYNDVDEVSVKIMKACKTGNVIKTISEIINMSEEFIDCNTINFWLSQAVQDIGRYANNIKNMGIYQICHNIAVDEMIQKKKYDSVCEAMNVQMKKMLMHVQVRKNGEDLYPYLDE